MIKMMDVDDETDEVGITYLDISQTTGVLTYLDMTTVLRNDELS